MGKGLISIKFLIFFGLIILIIIIYYSSQKNVPSQKYLNGDIEKIIEKYDGPIVIHPYLGFVYDFPKNSKANIYGFTGPEPIFHQSQNTVIIGIFGGSFAERYYADQSKNLISKIKQIPKYKSKKVEILSLAVGGYKQPQQLLTLIYFLSLGAKFDIIINIDGFNEAALSYSENLNNNISTYYPRSWNILSRKTYNSISLSLLNQINNHQLIINGLQSTRRLSINNIIEPFTRVLLTYEEAKLIQLNNKLTETLSDPKESYQISGQEILRLGKNERIGNIIKVWSNTSIQMSKIAKANGSNYFHLLQPNQYFPNSKVFTAEELKTAFLAIHPYRKAVELLYPELISEGKNLLRQGINFYDLSLIYKNIDKTVYIDNCCHINRIGNLKITEFIINLL